jgi:hypothetical protein
MAVNILAAIRAVLKAFHIQPNETVSSEKSAAVLKALAGHLNADDSSEQLESTWTTCLHNRNAKDGLLKIDLARLAVLLNVFDDSAMMTVKEIERSRINIYNQGDQPGLRSLVMRKLISAGLIQENIINVDASQNKGGEVPASSSNPNGCAKPTGSDEDVDPALKSAAQQSLEVVVAWASKSIAGFQASLSAEIYPSAIGDKLAALNETGANIFMKHGMTKSEKDVLFFVGQGKLNALRGASVKIIDEQSASLSLMELSDIELSGANGIILKGCVKQASAIPAQTNTNFRLIPDADRQASETRSEIQHAIFKTTFSRISGQVCIESLSEAAKSVNVHSFTTVDRRQALSMVGMATEIQGGGGKNACAPMSIMRHLLTAGGVKVSDATHNDLLAGATVLRKAAQQFLRHPEAVLALFRRYLTSFGVVAADKTQADIIEGVLFEILNDLSETDRLEFSVFAQMIEQRFPTGLPEVPVDAGLQRLRVSVLRALVNAMRDGGASEPVTIEQASNALTELKQELETTATTGARTLHVYSLLLSAAGVFHIAYVSPCETSFTLAPCFKVGRTQMALVYHMPSHWEAIISTDLSRMVFVDDAHVALMENVVTVWKFVEQTSRKGKRMAGKSASGPLPAVPSPTPTPTPTPTPVASPSHTQSGNSALLTQAINNLVDSLYKGRKAAHMQRCVRRAIQLNTIPLEFIHKAVQNDQCVFGNLCKFKATRCRLDHLAIRRAQPKSKPTSVSSSSAPSVVVAASSSSPILQSEQPSAQPSPPMEHQSHSELANVAAAMTATTKELSAVSQQMSQATKTWAAVAKKQLDQKPSDRQQQSNQQKSTPTVAQQSSQSKSQTKQHGRRPHADSVDPNPILEEADQRDLLSLLVENGILSTRLVKKFSRRK